MPLNNRNRRRIQDDFDVSFFPEGGNLVEGTFCKVAFKALKRDGTSESISGEIVDESGTIITSAETFYAGMGVFTFIPSMEKRYFLQCRNENGLEKQFELPKVDLRAYALTVSKRNKMLLIGVRKSEHNPEIPCYLLGHNRGMVFHFSSLNNINEPIVFPEESLPAGVLQFILFDEQMNPLSERLVFSKNYDTAKVEFQTDKAVYEKRDKVVATLSFGDNSPSLGNEGEQSLSPSPLERAGVMLSVSITDDRDIAVDSTTTILSSLLLSSELKGYIENPAYYLQDNIESATALDYLMLTHGWRRYNIPEVVKGNPAYPQLPFQESQQISGKVKTLALSRPVADSEILIMVKDGDFGITTTDEKGIFSYADFEYPDSTSYFIQALNKKGSNNVELVLNEETFPKPVRAPQSLHLTPTLSKGEGEGIATDAFIEKSEQRAKYDEDIRIIYLNEVEVTAPRIERKDETRLQFWANRYSDVTIRRQEIERNAFLYVSEVLRRIPGIQISSINGEVFIRGAQPYVLINGIPVENPWETLNINDVESIDVFKNTGAAMFGVRGANGVINITTRRGIDDISELNRFLDRQAINYTIYTPLGYQKPVEFYSPQYETLEAKHLSIPDYRTTIYWKPDIVISEETGETTFEFYTSDFPTTYSVVIEGITTEGQLIRQVEKINITEK